MQIMPQSCGHKRQSSGLTDNQAHLSRKDFVINNMFRAERIHVSPVEVELLQFILVLQWSTFYIYRSNLQQSNQFQLVDPFQLFHWNAIN